MADTKPTVVPLSNAASPHDNRLCTPAAIDFEKGEVEAPEEVQTS